MDAKEAIRVAKSYIADVFQDEGVFNIGLEEIEHHDDEWEVTIGFSRKWDRPPSSVFNFATGEQPDHRATSRTYKIVEVDDRSGNVSGVRNRPGLS